MSSLLQPEPACPSAEVLASLTSLRVVAGYRCHFRCAFCYQAYRDGLELAPAVLSRRLESLHASFSPRFVTLMGGEPADLPATPELVSLLRAVFPTAELSVTTNGSGTLAFYRDLQRRGLDNLTVSLQTLDPRRYPLITRQAVTTLPQLLERIVTLAGTGTVRINAYLFDDQVEPLYRFCKRHALKLTFCEDLREVGPPRPLVPPPGAALVFENDLRRIYRDADGFEIWNYKHVERFDYDNLIVLPDASLTLDFADIMAQRGR